MLNGLRPPYEHQRGSVSLDPLLILAVVFALGFVGVTVGMMAWMMSSWSGGHMGMMGRGNAGADQTPVVADAEQVAVEMRDYEFFPAKLTVNAGAEVTWQNRDAVPHNAVANDGAFDTGNLNGGESVSVVVEQPGSYAYVCTYHPGMEAVLTVL